MSFFDFQPIPEEPEEECGHCTLGKVECKSCYGSGKDECRECGHSYDCSKCDGQGEVDCPKCGKETPQ